MKFSEVNAEVRVQFAYFSCCNPLDLQFCNILELKNQRKKVFLEKKIIEWRRKINSQYLIQSIFSQLLKQNWSMVMRFLKYFSCLWRILMPFHRQPDVDEFES